MSDHVETKVGELLELMHTGQQDPMSQADTAPHPHVFAAPSRKSATERGRQVVGHLGQEILKRRDRRRGSFRYTYRGLSELSVERDAARRVFFLRHDGMECEVDDKRAEDWRDEIVCGDWVVFADVLGVPVWAAQKLYEQEAV